MVVSPRETVLRYPGPSSASSCSIQLPGGSTKFCRLTTFFSITVQLMYKINSPPALGPPTIFFPASTAWNCSMASHSSPLVGELASDSAWYRNGNGTKDSTVVNVTFRGRSPFEALYYSTCLRTLYDISLFFVLISMGPDKKRNPEAKTVF